MSEDEKHDIVEAAADLVYDAIKAALRNDIDTADDLADALIKLVEHTVSLGNA